MCMHLQRVLSVCNSANDRPVCREGQTNIYTCHMCSWCCMLYAHARDGLEMTSLLANDHSLRTQEAPWRTDCVFSVSKLTLFSDKLFLLICAPHNDTLALTS